MDILTTLVLRWLDMGGIKDGGTTTHTPGRCWRTFTTIDFDFITKTINIK